MGSPDDDFVEIPLGGDDSEKSKEAIESDRSELPKENVEPNRSELNETILKLEAAISEFFPDDKPKSLGVIDQLFVENLDAHKKLLISILNQKIVDLHSELDTLRKQRSNLVEKSVEHFNVVGNIRTREDLLRRLKEKELPGVEFSVAVQPASSPEKSSILSNIADGALAVGYGLVAGPFVGGAELTTKEQKNGISWLSPVGFFSNVYHRMRSNFAAPVSGLIAAASTAVLAPLFVAFIPVNMVLGANQERKRGSLSKTVSDFLNLGRKNRTEDPSHENQVSDILAGTHPRSTQTVASTSSHTSSPVLSEQHGNASKARPNEKDESRRAPSVVNDFNISRGRSTSFLPRSSAAARNADENREEKDKNKHKLGN